MSEEKLTTEEEEELFEALGGGYPKKQESVGIFNFFNKILRAKDTTKGAYLSEEEVRAVRIFQSTALYADKMGLGEVAKYLENEAEIILGSSLSKGGFLIESAISQRRKLEASTKQEKKKKNE
jgi:hypothetical protein